MRNAKYVMAERDKYGVDRVTAIYGNLKTCESHCRIEPGFKYVAKLANDQKIALFQDMATVKVTNILRNIRVGWESIHDILG